MIKMIKSTYGLVKDDGSVEAMTPASGPFSVNPTREAELIALGVAEKVETPDGEPYEGMKMSDLKKLAAERGVDVKAAKSKADVIAEIRAAEAHSEAAEVEE